MLENATDTQITTQWCAARSGIIKPVGAGTDRIELRIEVVAQSIQLIVLAWEVHQVSFLSNDDTDTLKCLPDSSCPQCEAQ